MFRTSTLAIAALLTVSPAAAECYTWPLRSVDNHVAYDGDTLYVTVPGLPPELADVSVRVRGIDTPERRGQCDEERYAAYQARDYLEAVLRGSDVKFCGVSWDKYGGRVDSDVFADGAPVADTMIEAGYAREYDGGKRAGWCR